MFSFTEAFHPLLNKDGGGLPTGHLFSIGRDDGGHAVGNSPIGNEHLGSVNDEVVPPVLSRGLDDGCFGMGDIGCKIIEKIS